MVAVSDQVNNNGLRVSIGNEDLGVVVKGGVAAGELNNRPLCGIAGSQNVAVGVHRGLLAIFIIEGAGVSGTILAGSHNLGFTAGGNADAGEHISVVPNADAQTIVVDLITDSVIYDEDNVTADELRIIKANAKNLVDEYVAPGCRNKCHPPPC